MKKVLSILTLSGIFLSVGFAQITIDLSSTDPNDLGPEPSQSSYTSTISYSSGVFKSSQTGIDVTGSLANLPDSFSFDLTITGYSSVSFDGTNLSLSSDDTKRLLTRGNGWGVVAKGGKQLLLDRKEGLLITFDNFVGIAEIEFSGVGIQDGRHPGGKLAVDRTDDSGEYKPLAEETYYEGGGLAEISFFESDSAASGSSYLVFSTPEDAGGFRFDRINLDAVTAASAQLSQK
ncbi:MAG: hypothetical protein AAF212_00095 [Verrucomicrobiota bacterium]